MYYLYDKEENNEGLCRSFLKKEKQKLKNLENSISKRSQFDTHQVHKMIVFIQLWCMVMIYTTNL